MNRCSGYHVHQWYMSRLAVMHNRVTVFTDVKGRPSPVIKHVLICLSALCALL